MHIFTIICQKFYYKNCDSKNYATKKRKAYISGKLKYMPFFKKRLVPLFAEKLLINTVFAGNHSQNISSGRDIAHIETMTGSSRYQLT